MTALAGATANLNTSTPGQAVLTFSSPTPLPAGPVDFVRLSATVPDNSAYTSKHLLDLTSVQVNDSFARDDDGVAIVGYLGDSSGNGGYSARTPPTSCVWRWDWTAVLPPTRWPTPCSSPTSPATAGSTPAMPTSFCGKRLGLHQAQIPALPANPPTLTRGGPDPLLYFPKRLPGRPGQTIEVPLLLSPSDGLESADLVISYDAQRLELVEVARGRLTADFDLFAVHAEAGTLRVGLGRSAGPIEGRGTGSILALTFRIRADAPGRACRDQFARDWGVTRTQLNEEGLT